MEQESNPMPFDKGITAITVLSRMSLKFEEKKMVCSNEGTAHKNPGFYLNVYDLVAEIDSL